MLFRDDTTNSCKTHTNTAAISLYVLAVRSFKITIFLPFLDVTSISQGG